MTSCEKEKVLINAELERSNIHKLLQNVLFGFNDVTTLTMNSSNLDLTKYQGTGEIGSLYRGFVISRFFSIHYAITELKNIVRYTEDFLI